MDVWTKWAKCLRIAGIYAQVDQALRQREKGERREALGKFALVRRLEKEVRG